MVPIQIPSHPSGPTSSPTPASKTTRRLYDEPDGYERRLPYRAVATVSIMADRAWLAGLHGRFDRGGWREIEAWLRSRGITAAVMERHGRIITLTDEEHE